MRDMNLLDAGPSLVARPIRRALLRVLRPMLARLNEVLHSLADRLDAAEAKLNGAEPRLLAAEGRLDKLQGRSDLTFEKLRHAEGRFDQAELRLDVTERSDEIHRRQIDGLASHLEGLTGEHHELRDRFNHLSGHDGWIAVLEDRLRAFEALHWDHVALARRLAAIEDRLSLLDGSPETADALPFPGLDGFPSRAV
jgi:chromosome segregation ATPase